MEMVSLPPPDRVPMMAPHRHRAVANDDTWWEIRPSTMEAPRVPALRLRIPVHNGGAFCQVTQAHAVCVTDANAGRNDVVHHAWNVTNRNWAADAGGCAIWKSATARGP